MTETKTKKVIGRAERVSFPELGFAAVPARIDTGAKTSAIWASSVERHGDHLQVVFFGEGSEQYTGQTVAFDSFEEIIVASSNGQAEKRYKVRLLVKIAGKKVRAGFTLADRSTQVYPVLIGRNVLTGKFLVDVKKGHVLREAEQQRSEALQTQADHDESPEEDV